MGKIQTNAQHKFRYETIAKAEGEQCIVCWIEKHRHVKPPKRKLVIEHADNDQTNWAWTNLHLVCYSHNKKMERLSRARKIATLRAYGDQLERERERENLPTWNTVLSGMVPVETGCTVVQLRRMYERKWLDYAHQLLAERITVGRKEFIASAAKKAGCSKQTSTNYYEVHTSAEGTFQEALDGDGNPSIMFRALPVLRVNSALKASRATKRRKNEQSTGTVN